MSTDVSVIVPCCNQGDWVRTAVADIHESLGRLSHEIVVIDDHSTDRSCTGLGTGATILLPRARLGCSGSRKYGIERSSGEVLILADPHCTFGKPSLQTLAQMAAKSNAVWQPRVRCRLDDPVGYSGAQLTITERGLANRPVKTTAKHPAAWGSIYAFRRELVEAMFGSDGWPVLPGVWGTSEQMLSLAAWVADVPIMVADDVLCTHHGYKDNQFPYHMPKSDWAANCHWVHSAVFPETYVPYWLPMLESHFGKAPANRLPMTDKATMPIYGSLCKHIASTRKHDERSCFTDLLGATYPLSDSTPMPESDLITEQARRSTARDHTEAHGRIDRSLQWLVKSIPGCLKNRRVLVLGCRDGYDAETIRKYGAKAVEGVELVPTTAEFANATRTVTVRQGDMRKLPDLDGSWDLVVSIHSLEHVPEPEVARKEMSRVLAPGGWLYVAVPSEPFPNSGEIDGGHHAAWQTPEELVAFLGAASEFDSSTAIQTITDAKKQHHREVRVLIKKKAATVVRRRSPKIKGAVVRTDAGNIPEISRRCHRHLMMQLRRGYAVVEILQHSTVRPDVRSVLVNIMSSLNRCPNGIVYLVEYDCLYPPGYFNRKVRRGEIHVTSDVLYLDQWGYHQRPRNMPPESTVVGHRETLRNTVWKTITSTDRTGPKLTRPGPGVQLVKYSLDVPVIDIRHGTNITGTRATERTDAHFSLHPYWGDAEKLYAQFVPTSQ